MGRTLAIRDARSSISLQVQFWGLSNSKFTCREMLLRAGDWKCKREKMSLLEEICSCNSWFVSKKILKIMKNYTKKDE